MSKEALKDLITELIGTVALHDMQAAKRFGHIAKTMLAEQPAQQEPVGYFKAKLFGWTGCAETDEGAVALYTTPQAQRKPLTEQAFEALYCKAKGYVQTGLMDVVRLVENHHGIKENQS